MGTIVIGRHLYISLTRQLGGDPHARCTRCNDSSSLNAIIRFTWTPGRRMSREFLRTCSNTLPLLVETVEAVRRYIEGGTDSFIMTVAHGEEEEGQERAGTH